MDDYSTGDHRNILRAGLQPGFEPAAEAFDVVDPPGVDRTKKGSASSVHCFELLLSGRIDSEGVAEPDW